MERPSKVEPNQRWRWNCLLPNCPDVCGTTIRVWKTAAREAVDRLAIALQQHPEVRIINEPQVTAVLVPDAPRGLKR